MVTQTKRLIVFSVLVCLLSAACYGRFSLTRTVYDWNGDIENQFLQSAVMVALIVLPAYPIAAVTDLLVFNVVEFWTGENPVLEPSVDEKRVVIGGEGHKPMVTAVLLDDRETVSISVREPQGEGQLPPGSGAGVLLRLQPDGAVLAEPTHGGMPMLARPQADGGLELRSWDDRRLIRYMDYQEVEELLRSHGIKAEEQGEDP